MTNYDEKFYEGQRGESRRSAALILPEVFDIVGRPASIVDLGCGVGTWLAVARDLGVPDVIGVDGPYVRPEALEIPQSCFQPADLTSPLKLGRRFDLVMTLEVAEHLPETASDNFVDSLAGHGDLILFSAAIPGQGGVQHINERWPSYWVAKFAKHGFELFDILRPIFWSDSSISTWYSQNVLLFARGERASELQSRISQSGLLTMPILDVVHPFSLEAATRMANAPLSVVATRRGKERFKRLVNR